MAHVGVPVAKLVNILNFNTETLCFPSFRVCARRSSDDGGLIALGKDELKEMNVQTIAQSTISMAATRDGLPALR